MTLAAHVISRHFGFGLMVLNGVKNVLSNEQPIGGNRFGVCIDGSVAAVVVIKLTPQIKHTRNARCKGWLCKEKIRFYFFNHALLSSSIG